jgi:hypothetical protein
MKFISFSVEFAVFNQDNPYDALTQVEYLDSLSSYIDGSQNRPPNLVSSEIIIMDHADAVG